MTGKLRRDLGFADGDAVYQRLVEVTAGLDEDKARFAMAKFCLLLANHIGDEEVIAEAVAAARDGVAE